MIAAAGLAACGHSVQRFTVQPEYQRRTPRCIGIVPLENLSLTSLAGLAVGELLAADLERTGQFVVLEPTAYRWVVEQSPRRSLEPTEPDALRFFRRELGLDAIVVGSLTEYWYTDDPQVYRDKQPSVSLNVRMISTDDGTTLFSATSSRTPSSISPRLNMISEVAASMSLDIAGALVADMPPETLERRVPSCRFEELLVAGAAMKRERPERRQAQRSEPRVSESPELSSAASELADRLRRGEAFVLRGVGFEYRTTEIKPGGTDKLEAVGELLRGYRDMVVNLVVHTDNRGDPDELRNLTERQGAAVRDWLVENAGVNAQQILTDGRGGDEPLLPNINRRNRQINRRVEVQLLSPPSGGW